LLLSAALPWIAVWRPVERASAFVIVERASSGPTDASRAFDRWTAGLWALAAASALRLLWIAHGLWRLSRLRRVAHAAPEPGVWTAPVGTPVTFGWRVPMIVAPEPLWSSATPAMKAAILAHERAHIARWDFAWNVAIELATVPLWWHPCVIWMKRRLAVLREFACDEWAAAADPGYAKSLLDAASTLAGIRRPAVALGPPVALGLFDSDSLEARMLNLIRPVPVLRRRLAQGLTVFALAAIALTAAVSTRFPVFAQERKVHKAGVDGVESPRMLYKVEPRYSKEAKDAGIEGKVVLSVVIDEVGHADEIEVTTPLIDSLDTEAVKAIKQWRFTPGTKDGLPVPVRATIEVNYRLMP